MKTELLKTIARIRRAMPRNADVMEVCDYAEKRLIAPPLIIQSEGTVTIKQAGPHTFPKGSPFNKTEYMRYYMRKRREQKKSNASA